MKNAVLLILLAVLVAACAPTETAELSPSIVTDTEAPAEPEMIGDVIGELENGEAPSPSTPPPEQIAPSSITRAELMQHNTARDCWVGYQGKVYDLTAWLVAHPGGAAAIAPYCGTAEEFTQAYQAQHRRADSTRISNRGEEQGTLAQ